MVTSRAGWYTRWRRRHLRPFDWAEVLPELRLPPASHVRLVSAWPPPSHPMRRRP